jgi:hypothetical protein
VESCLSADWLSANTIKDRNAAWKVDCESQNTRLPPQKYETLQIISISEEFAKMVCLETLSESGFIQFKNFQDETRTAVARLERVTNGSGSAAHLVGKTPACGTPAGKKAQNSK